MSDPFTRIETPNAATATGGYAPALVWRDLVFVSGQGSIDSAGTTIPGTIEEETERTLRNIQELLRAAGSDLDRVLKCTCYLADIADFDSFDAAYRAVFGSHLPARSTVQAGLDGIKVEIDAIAAL